MAISCEKNEQGTELKSFFHGKSIFGFLSNSSGETFLIKKNGAMEQLLPLADVVSKPVKLKSGLQECNNESPSNLISNLADILKRFLVFKAKTSRNITNIVFIHNTTTC